MDPPLLDIEGHRRSSPPADNAGSFPSHEKEHQRSSTKHEPNAWNNEQDASIACFGG
uniref:Uncharacterized protein n=1 Tax=Arundo donax TaxID=35708 RepID=A0A0A9FXK4_ARUDO